VTDFHALATHMRPCESFGKLEMLNYAAVHDLGINNSIILCHDRGVNFSIKPMTDWTSFFIHDLSSDSGILLCHDGESLFLPRIQEKYNYAIESRARVDRRSRRRFKIQ
jgi:hypothetical protein